MKVSKISYVLLVLLVVLFSMGASCANLTNKRGDDAVASPYYGGFEGLVADFEEIGTVSDTTAQNEVWEDESFPVRLHLLNKGEYTVPAHDVKLEIKGISQTDFSGLAFTEDNDDELEKVSEFLPDGGEVFIDFGDAKYEQLEGTHYDANLYVYYDYPYETYINIPKVCYKENIKDDTICNVDSTKQAFSSGGPIQVGTVRERYVGKGKILLEIPITNKQKGKTKAAKNDEFRPEWDEVYFETDDPDWECKSRGNPNVARITHPGGERGNEEVTIVCTNVNLEKDALFTKAVTLKLTYHYQDWINQVVRIRENPE